MKWVNSAPKNKKRVTAWWNCNFKTNFLPLFLPLFAWCQESRAHVLRLWRDQADCYSWCYPCLMHIHNGLKIAQTLCNWSSSSFRVDWHFWGTNRNCETGYESTFVSCCLVVEFFFEGGGCSFIFLRAFIPLSIFIFHLNSAAQAQKSHHEVGWMKSLNNGKALFNSNSLSREKGHINEHCPLYFEKVMNMWALRSVPRGEDASCEVEAVPGLSS